MRKIIIVTIFVLLANTLMIGCTSQKSLQEPPNVKAKEKSDLKKTNKEDAKDLGGSFKEIIDLKKPNIEDARDFEASLRNGSVIMISRENSEELEVYNISMLDKFLDSFNNGKQGYVCVIKGTLKTDGKILVNKLEEFETDGKVIKDTAYDTYSDKNKFIQGKPTYPAKMVKTYPGDGIRYAILESKDTPDNMGGTVISFNKNSIKNKK